MPKFEFFYQYRAFQAYGGVRQEFLESKVLHLDSEDELKTTFNNWVQRAQGGEEEILFISATITNDDGHGTKRTGGQLHIECMDCRAIVPVKPDHRGRRCPSCKINPRQHTW